MHVVTPKLKVPFQIEGASALVVEQDEVDEIEQCVRAVLGTVQGEREDRPEFGVPDLAFKSTGVNSRLVRAAVNRWEPRASVDTIEHVLGTTEEIHVIVGRKGN